MVKITELDKITEFTVDSFDTLIDKFLEIYFGKYGRPDQFTNVKLELNI